MRALLFTLALVLVAGAASAALGPRPPAWTVVHAPQPHAPQPHAPQPPGPRPELPRAPVARPAPPSPVRFDEPKIDFGLVAHGEVVRRTFRYLNGGALPVSIVDVKTSCGCTAAEPTRRALQPGEGGEVEVAFNTASKHVPGGRRRFVNSVRFTVREARPEAPVTVAELFLEGDVAVRYQLVPEGGLHFPGRPQGAPETPALTVEVLPAAAPLPGEPPPPALVPGAGGAGGARVLSAPPQIEVREISPVERDGRRGVAISCAVRADAPVGALQGALVLATGHPVQPQVSIPVRAWIHPPVMPVPPRLILAEERPGEARTVRLQAARPIRVIHAAAVTASGAAAPLAVEQGPRPDQVTVRTPPGGTGGGAAGGAAGSVLVFIDDERVPVVEVPYHIRRLAPQGSAVAAQRAEGVVVSPAELYVGDLRPDAMAALSVVVARIGRDPRPLDVGDLRVDPEDALEARLEAVDPGRVARIAIQVRGVRPGPFEGRVAFSPRPGAAPLSVRVTGRVNPRVDVSPAALFVRGGREAAVVLRRVDGRPLRALSAEDPAGRSEVAIEPETAGGGVRLVVRPRPASGARPGEGEGARALREVLVRTDVPGEEVVRVPLLEVPERAP